MEKVWIYLSDKELNGEVLNSVLSRGKEFVENWKAHDVPLKATFEIIAHRFIVVKVDETQYNASGCSIDKLLRLVKQLETDFNLQLLNRLLVPIKNSNGVEVVHSSKIKELLNNKKINENTIVFNTASSNSVEFAGWEQPLKDTWLKKYL